MRSGLLIVVVALGWAAATGSFSVANLIFGALVGAVGLFLVRGRLSERVGLRRFWRILSLAGLFLYELFASATRVALLVIRPNLRASLRPAIVAFPLKLTNDAEITLLANLITLTPGTLSVDVSDDRKFLYVHAVSLRSRDELIESISRGFERKIMEAFE